MHTREDQENIVTMTLGYHTRLTANLRIASSVPELLATKAAMPPPHCERGRPARDKQKAKVTTTGGREFPRAGPRSCWVEPRGGGVYAATSVSSYIWRSSTLGWFSKSAALFCTSPFLTQWQYTLKAHPSITLRSVLMR